MWRRAAAGVASILVAGTLAGEAAAQAWPAPAGTGSVGVTTQIIDNTGHRMTDGFLLEEGKSRNVSIFIDGDFAVTDRLAVSVGLPYVFSRFIGPQDSPANLPVDACRCWNSGFQDFSASLRYTILEGAFALTPVMGIGVPSHSYLYEGEAVVGYGLMELRIGVDAGLRLSGLSERVALTGRYAYVVVEDAANVPNNRSNAYAGASVAASPRFSARGGVSWQRTHGGLRFGSFTGVPFPPPGEANTPELFRQHDRLLRDNYWHIGGGVTYSLPRVDVFVSYRQFVGGTDTHAGKAFTFGTSVPFEWR
jgi:hypothetical protein